MIQNEYLKMVVSEDGGELVSVKDCQTDFEYIWEANPKYWGRHAPILFPIVGKLTGNTYFFNDKKYALPQHGFARDQKFKLKEKNNKIIAELINTNDTEKIYPFEFKLTLEYELIDRTIKFTWFVWAKEELYFSIGAHPAFNLSDWENEDGFKYKLYFGQVFDMKRRMLNKQNQLMDSYVSLGTNDTLVVSADLFKQDAIVFDDFSFDHVQIYNEQKKCALITMDVSGFRFKDAKRSFGIWSPYKNGEVAPFLCLEPWFGHADLENGPFEIQNKEGIIHLEREEFSAFYSVTFHEQEA